MDEKLSRSIKKSQIEGPSPTDLAILGSTPFFSSSKLMVTGSVADDEAVPKAVVKAFVMLAMNLAFENDNCLRS